MKKIPLSKYGRKNKGKYFALIDDEDFEAINKIDWCCTGHYGVCDYAHARIKGKLISMHRYILKSDKGEYTDHKNRNGLDNRKENLRICSQSQNQYNRKKQVNNTSGFKGISWHKKSKKWQVNLRIPGKQLYFGLYSNKEKALEVYNQNIKRICGEFARN